MKVITLSIMDIDKYDSLHINLIHFYEKKNRFVRRN